MYGKGDGQILLGGFFGKGGGGPVLKIEFGPPHADFGSVWSPQKST